MSSYLACGEIVKVKYVFYKLFVVFVDASVLMRLVNESEHLAFGYCIELLRLEDLRKKLLPKHKDSIDRHENKYEATKNARYSHSKALCVLLCNALRRDLAEDKHHNCYYCSRYSRSGRFKGSLLEALNKEDGGKRGKRYVNYIVSYKNGRKKLIVIVRKLHGGSGTLVTLGSKIFHLGSVKRGVSGLACRKEGRKSHKNDHYNDVEGTPVRHN